MLLDVGSLSLDLFGSRTHSVVQHLAGCSCISSDSSADHIEKSGLSSSARSLHECTVKIRVLVVQWSAIGTAVQFELCSSVRWKSWR